ncbi:MAG: hypothetical protein ACOCP8_09765 [archaeon]
MIKEGDTVIVNMPMYGKIKPIGIVEDDLILNMCYVKMPNGKRHIISKSNLIGKKK